MLELSRSGSSAMNSLIPLAIRFQKQTHLYMLTSVLIRSNYLIYTPHPVMRFSSGSGSMGIPVMYHQM